MTCRAPRRAVAATALFGLALLAVPAARAAQTWAQLPVFTPAEALLETRTNDGALHLLFQVMEDGRVRDAVSRDAGTTWAFRDISVDAATTASFDLTVDASNQTLTHVAYAGAGLVYARAAGTSTTWTRTTLDATPGAGATGVAVAALADTVAVLYRRDDALWLIRSTDEGTTWAAATEVAPAASGLLSLTIDPSGTMHALYPFADGTGPVYARSTDSGATWTETAVSGDASPIGSRQLLAIDPGLLVAAFSTASGVRVARSTDDGATWKVEKLADGTGAALALDGTGTFHLAWVGTDGNTVKLANSVDAHSWNRETIESAPGSDPRDALVAVSGEAVFVPFVQFEADLVAAWNGGTPAPPDPVDITGDATESDAELSAWLETQWYDPIDDDWYFRYAFSYRNGGRATATGVSILADTPVLSETVDASSWLPLSGMREPGRMTWGIGSLSRFDSGRAWLSVRAPGSTAPGSELLMHAEMTNDAAESDTVDNVAEVRHAVPLLAPLASSPPLGGQTCRTGLQVGGGAQPGVTVALRRDGFPVGSAEVGLDRTFAIPQAGLDDGVYVFSLVAEYGGIVSPAQEFTLAVDTSLAADPLAIILVDGEGRVQRLNDGQGQASLDSGWRNLRLAPGGSYTLGVPSCCPTEPANQIWSLTLADGGTPQPLVYDAASGLFEGSFEIPYGTPPGTRIPVTVLYRCEAFEPVATLVATGTENGMVVAAGRLYDASGGKGIDDPVAGILSTLWAGRPATGLGGIPTIAWLPWPAEQFGMAPNPQETGPDGHAPFYPPPGRYRWIAADPARVFEGYGTPSQVIVGGAFDPTVPLSLDEPLTRRIVLSDEPVSGRLNVSEDDVVEWVNADDRPHRVLSRTDPALGTGGWDSGEIPPGGRYRKLFDRLGDYTWTDAAVGGEARIVARKLYVTPEAGTEGTNLVINDEGFGSGKGTVQVGGTPCKVKNWNDTQIVCSVKEVLPPAIYDVRVIPKKGTDRTYVSAFEAKPPTLRSVLPAIGKKGTKVRLAGSYWGTKKGTVTVGGKKAKVSSWLMGATTGESVIDIKIPKLDPGSYDIVVEAPTGTVTLTGGFTVE